MSSNKDTEAPERIYLPAGTDDNTWNVLAKNPSRNWKTDEPANNIEYARVDPPAVPMCAVEQLRAVRQILAEYEDDEALQIQARAIDQFLASISVHGSPDKADKALAQQILKKISEATLELAFVRHDLTSDEVDIDDDADVKTRVVANEEFLERLKEDTLNCLTGDDFGCLDPEELDASNCELIWLAAALAQARKEAAQQTWQPIETAPKDGRTLLLCYTNSSGKWRTVRGQWFTDEEIGEWDNADDFEAWWYETSEENDEPPNCWLINPTHWMPLPEPPALESASKQEVNQNE